MYEPAGSMNVLADMVEPKTCGIALEPIERTAGHDLDRLEEAGLLGRAPLPDELRSALGLTSDAEANEAADIEADELAPFEE